MLIAAISNFGRLLAVHIRLTGSDCASGTIPLRPMSHFLFPPGRVSLWTTSAMSGGLPNLDTMMCFVSIRAKRS